MLSPLLYLLIKKTPSPERVRRVKALYVYHVKSALLRIPRFCSIRMRELGFEKVDQPGFWFSESDHGSETIVK